MKVKVLKHSSLKTNIDDDIIKMNVYFQSDFVKRYIDITLVIDIEDTSLNYNDQKLIDENYDTTMLIFEKGTFPIYGGTYPTGLCLVSVNSIEDKIDYSWKVMVHELLHSIWYKIMADKKVIIPNLLDNSLPTPYFHNDDPYFVGGNFQQQLEVLKPYFSQYVYFKPSEIIGLKPELVSLLDKMRGLAGTPFVITSGFRTSEQNTKVGGKPNSAHLRGLAVDIACSDNKKRKYALRGILGVTEPYFLEIAKKHLHIDIDSSIHTLDQVMLSEDN